jgi:hypothetical protein
LSDRDVRSPVGNKTAAINYASAFLLDPAIFSRMGGKAVRR